MCDKIKKALNQYAKENYNCGYLQGVYDFYKALKETHESPKEIYDRLIGGNKNCN